MHLCLHVSWFVYNYKSYPLIIILIANNIVFFLEIQFERTVSDIWPMTRYRFCPKFHLNGIQSNAMLLLIIQELYYLGVAISDSLNNSII